MISCVAFPPVVWTEGVYKEKTSVEPYIIYSWQRPELMKYLYTQTDESKTVLR